MHKQDAIKTHDFDPHLGDYWQFVHVEGLFLR